MEQLYPCCNCGRLVPVPGYFESFTPENLERAVRSLACPECERAVSARREQEKAALDRESELEETKRKLAERYADRIEESQLNTYALGYDPQHPKANRALMSWVTRNMNSCIWLTGDSGTCKTRTIQCAARKACRDRTVRYWPALDLAARLTETAKHPESQLKDLYGADLLIIDDLGKEPLTAARLSSLAAIVDRRYIGWDQVRRLKGNDHPTFGLGMASGRLGGQIWITSQLEPAALAERLSAVDQNDATAIVRRLAEMCVLHRA